MRYSSSKRFLGFAVFLSTIAHVFSPLSAFASTGVFSVSPLIFDEKAKQRDILKESIGVMNNSVTRSINLYAFVNNINPAEGVEGFQNASDADLGKSLANWIEISRGAIDLMPGEKREIPLLIQVNLRASAGMYHAFISFSEGSTRAEAEKNLGKGISVAVNVEILDDAKEVLELKSFVPAHTFVTGKIASFMYDIQNVGNRPLAPRGQVRIFNRSGEEVAALDINQEGDSLGPNISSQLASAWDAGSRFGRYKALLDVEYGDKQRGTLQDTVFFWLIPWKEMLAVFLSFGVIVFSLVLYWYNNYIIGRRQKLAHSMAFAFTEPDMQPYSANRETVQTKPVLVAHEAVRLSPREKKADDKPAYVVNLKK